MTEEPKITELKALLAEAEARIVRLQEEKVGQSAFIDSLMVDQDQMAQQSVALTEQIWKLEEALMSSSTEREEALALIADLRGNIDRISALAESTLESVKKQETRLKTAVRVFEIKSLVEELKEREKKARRVG